MRRQIMALVVGLTTLVILAFAIPVGFLIQSAVVASAERAAVQQANNLALVARNSTSAELQASLNLLPQDADHRSSVQLSNGTLLGKLPPAGDQTPGYAGAPVPPGPEPDRNGRGGPLPGGPGGEQAQLRQVPGGEVAELAVRTSSGDMALVQVYVSDAALHSGVVRWLLLLGGACIALLLLSALGAELLAAFRHFIEHPVGLMI